MVLAAGVGVLAGAIMAFVRPGLSWAVVLLAAGVAAFATAADRREPFTLACAGLSVLLLMPLVLRDNPGIVALCARGLGRGVPDRVARARAPCPASS